MAKKKKRSGDYVIQKTSMLNEIIIYDDGLITDLDDKVLCRNFVTSELKPNKTEELIISYNDGMILRSFVDSGYPYIISIDSLYTEVSNDAGSLMNKPEFEKLRDFIKLNDNLTFIIEYKSKKYSNIINPEFDDLCIIAAIDNETGEYADFLEIVKMGVKHNTYINGKTQSVINSNDVNTAGIYVIRDNVYHFAYLNWYKRMQTSKENITDDMIVSMISSGMDTTLDRFNFTGEQLDRIEYLRTVYFWYYNKVVELMDMFKAVNFTDSYDFRLYVVKYLKANDIFNISELLIENKDYNKGFVQFNADMKAWFDANYKYVIDSYEIEQIRKS